MRRRAVPDIATTLVLVQHSSMPHVLMVQEPRAVLDIDPRSGQILRDSHAPHALVLPGGHIEPGEPPSMAARRELREETGMRAGELVELGSYRAENHLVAAYYARDVIGELRTSPEGIPIWVALPEALASAHGSYVAWLIRRATAVPRQGRQGPSRRVARDL